MTLRRTTIDQLPDRRGSAVDADALRIARQIVDDVIDRGEPAVREHAARLGDIPTPGAPIRRDVDALRAAAAALNDAERGVLERTAARIESFARAQMDALAAGEIQTPGGVAGWSVLPVACAGCYAPGGRYPLPSSVLMTAVTAREAGVETIVVASPRPTPLTLAAASIAGADTLLAVGGAQAIAALALGIGGVAACETITGPGNAYVTAAKYLLANRVRIDMLAGPSELLIVADDSADPSVVAADLLAQAEHDADAMPMLIALSEGIIDEVEQSLEEQLTTLPTAETARESLRRNGFALRTESLDEAARCCDSIAPEHLQLSMRDAEQFASKVSNYGAVFIGERAAEVFGDYGFGPNHVLPTGRAARHTSGLSVMNFLRLPTWLRVDDEMAASDAIDDAIALARMERLEAHARAAERRQV